MSADASGTPRRRWLASALTLAAIGAASAAVLSLVDRATHARIARNEQAWIATRLDALIPSDAHDNDLLTDRTDFVAPELLGTARPMPVYRARLKGEPVAAIVHSVAPDGYRGSIELLVAIRRDGTLIGVQVLAHQETPGLGDAFEKRDAGWLDRFAGRSLSDPPQQRWTVRKDGGDFDAFTGATITPRAIVHGVRRTLEFYALNEERIFQQKRSR
jgi:electron transport complex protein RnfG